MRDKNIKESVRLQNKLIFLFILNVRARKETEREREQAQDTSGHTHLSAHAHLIHKVGEERTAITSAGLSIRRDGTAPKGPTEPHNPFFPIQIYFFLSGS
jgi:hypothetical protein